MKLKTGLLLLLLPVQFTWANMSSPIRSGTLSGSAISSKDIHILSESIYIRTDRNFKTAKFIVEYNIQSDTSGKQIPLLFYARDFKDSFFVWLDNRRINIQDVPVTHFGNSPFGNFAKPLEKNINGDEVIIYWQKNEGYTYQLSDLKYFEADIEKGIHTVRVEYTADVWTDVSGWIKKFSFRYSLAPARYWKSFGSLKIMVEQEGPVKQIVTDLGLPDEKEIKPINTWTFNQLPGEYFEISFTPPVSRFAEALITAEPFGIAIIVTALMIMVHLFLTLAYRRRNINRKYSIVVIAGSIIVPLLSLLSYMYAYSFIDNAIGENAGRHHGYFFLSIIWYPVILIIYWLLFWLMDSQYKRYLIRKRITDNQ